MRRARICLALLSLLLAPVARAAISEAALDGVPAVRVVRPGVAVPGTPAALNASVTVRYGSARPSAVLLLMPGYLGGAGSLDRLARQLAALDPTLAVWAFERRGNLLEAHAEIAAAGPARLREIVRRGLTPLPPAQVGYMASWGLDMLLRDLRLAVREARTLTPRVFLGGHSLGASLSALYAAYDFGGEAGFRDLRGLVLLDGVPGLLSQQPLTMGEYEQGAIGQLGPLLGRRGVAARPYVEGAVFGPRLASRAAAQARLAAADPLGPAPLGGLTPYAATNLAAGLLQLERRYAVLPFLALRAGQATNAVELPFLPAWALGNRGGAWIAGPQNPARPVGFEADPGAPTDPQDFVRRYWNARSDYAEWYFPTRLLLDVAAARLDTRGTPFERELPVWHAAEATLPMLGIAAEAGVATEAAYRIYAAGRRGPLTTRLLPGAAHLDILAARGDRVARWVLDWMAPLRR